MAASSDNAARHVLQALRYAPGCRVEDLVQSCSCLTWHDVFDALVTLRRKGRLEVIAEETGVCRLRLPPGRTSDQRHGRPRSHP